MNSSMILPMFDIERYEFNELENLIIKMCNHITNDNCDSFLEFSKKYKTDDLFGTIFVIHETHIIAKGYLTWNQIFDFKIGIIIFGDAKIEKNKLKD